MAYLNRWGFRLGAIAAVGLAAAQGCSTQGDDPGETGGASGNSGASGASGSSGNSGSGAGNVGNTSGSSGSSGSGGIIIDGGGSGGTTATDGPCSAVSQSAIVAPIDIIWAIDTSGSMGDEVDKVNQNLNTAFVPRISAATNNYQVIMVATRGTGNLQICVQPPLGGANCGNNNPIFFHLNCPVESNDALSILQQTYKGTNPFCSGRRWDTALRPGSKKFFVVVTDDEAETPFFNANQFKAWAANAQPAGVFGTDADKDWVFYGIIGKDVNDPTKACSTRVGDSGTGNSAVAPGLEYQKLAQETGGLTRSICEDDWGDVFEALSQSVVNNLGCEYGVPAPTGGGQIDTNAVNVDFTSSEAGKERILADPNRPCDDPDPTKRADGWQWNAAKTRIKLCGNACERVRSDDRGKIDIVLGCKTDERPPPT